MSFEMMDIIVNAQDNLPRNIRHTIGQRMINDAYELTTLIIRAFNTRNGKSDIVAEVHSKVESLGVGYRLLSKHRFISRKRQARLLELLSEMTKQSSAWLRKELGKIPNES